MKKALIVATVGIHLQAFHKPYMQWLRDNGYTVHAAANGSVELPCDEFFDLPFERTPFSLKNFAAARELKKLARENHYDIIHFHTPVASVFGRFAVKSERRRGTKVLYTAHGFHFFKGAPMINWLCFYPMERICARFTDVLFVMNREDLTIANKRLKPGKGMRVVYTPGVGLDISRFEHASPLPRADLGVPGDAFLILSVGELSARKNHETLINTLVYCPDDVHLIIAGTGENRDALTALACELGVIDQLHLLGYRTDTSRLYKTADAFVFPSLHEGLPVSVMEAMSARCACIVSSCRGCTDLIEDGVSGLICPPCDDGAFALAIKRIRTDAEFKRSCTDAARERVNAFSLDAALKTVTDVYKQL